MKRAAFSRQNQMEEADLKSRIAELRNKKNLKQIELAKLCDVTLNTIANWERNRRGLEWFATVARLCKVLRCEAHDLLKSEEPLLSNIADLRNREQLTQLELAEECGVTPNTVANWEKNRKGLEWFFRIAKLCGSLDCSPEELLEFIPPIKQIQPIKLKDLQEAGKIAGDKEEECISESSL
jgi:transcriptional regulator with XRE-family HTH domain